MTAQHASQKPKALRAGSRIAPFAPASPAKPDRIAAGKKELERLGFSVSPQGAMNPQGYFTGSPEERRREFLDALADPSIAALVATRGGFGSAYLLDDAFPDVSSEPLAEGGILRGRGLQPKLETSAGKEALAPEGTAPLVKPIIGFSDITTLQIYLWQKQRWPTFYGPMLAAGLDSGPDAADGYDSQSFRNALVNSAAWQTPLHGEALQNGSAEGVLLGGAMTLVEATLGTPWELDTANSILILEDRAMKPYQIDRVLLHLKHAGKFDRVRGIILGDFPECDPPVPNSPSVSDTARRILTPLNIPVVFGAPIGHTKRPLLTLPLGAPARLIAEGSGTLEFPEPTVIP